MSAIFDDASRILHSTPTRRPLSANARRLRMPLVDNHGAAAGMTEADGENFSLHHGTLPENAGKETWFDYMPKPPCSSPSLKVTPVQSPSCDNRPTSSTSGAVHMKYSCDGAGTGPTLSGCTRTTTGEVNEMAEYPNLTTLSTFTTGQGPGTPTTPSVEHISPLTSPSISRQLLWRPSGFRGSSRTPTRFSPPVSRGPLTEPPKCKIPRLSPVKKGSSADRDAPIIIYEDSTAEPLVELSPGVERYRKGQRPPRERCASYWDRDILSKYTETPDRSPKSPSPRKVLGELVSPTKAKGFIDGIENASFDFQIQP
ncbi:MAG: hypothetical protein Q9219_001091 [cf. Caloplaca sp. 3 TL-2023]